MNVLLINGSPHANGCTDAALREVAKALNADGKAKRAAAEQELGRIEGELRAKLLELNQ